MKDDFCTYLTANGERYEEILKVKKFDDDVSNYWGRKIFVNVHKYLLNHEYANCEEFWLANGMDKTDYSISSWEFQENINKLDKTITNGNVQKLYEEIVDAEMKACSIRKFLEIYEKVTESMTDRQDELKKADFTNEEEKRTLKNQNRIFAIIADALDKAGQSLEKLLEQERYQKYQKTIPKINFGCFLNKIAVSLSDFPDEEVDQVFFQPRDPHKSNFIQYDMSKLIYFVNGRNKVVPKGISDPSNKDLSDLMTQLLSVVNPILIEALMDEKKPNDGFLDFSTFAKVMNDHGIQFKSPDRKLIYDHYTPKPTQDHTMTVSSLNDSRGRINILLFCYDLLWIADETKKDKRYAVLLNPKDNVLEAFYMDVVDNCGTIDEWAKKICETKDTGQLTHAEMLTKIIAVNLRYTMPEIYVIYKELDSLKRGCLAEYQ
jgi:hypothetical protein